jgi:hypothetical protein
MAYQTVPMFSYNISHTALFSGKKLLNTKCVFCFSQQLLPETYLNSMTKLIVAFHNTANVPKNGPTTRTDYTVLLFSDR